MATDLGRLTIMAVEFAWWLAESRALELRYTSVHVYCIIWQGS